MTLLRLNIALVVAVAACASCNEKKASAPQVAAVAKPGPSTKLEPLEPVVDTDAGADSVFSIVPLKVVGPALPPEVVTVKVVGETTPFDGAAKRVLLAVDDETYLAQVAALFSKFDDAGVKVWLKHPEADVAFEVVLRDEPAFQAWLAESVPGKLRVIHRADGFELQTNVGKLPGPDTNGPSVPVRAGKMNLTTLQRALQKIAKRFEGAPDVCFVPSFGMPLNETIRAMAANYPEVEKPVFGGVCLVYPRPRALDAGR